MNRVDREWPPTSHRDFYKMRLRREALAKPWPARWFAYYGWLVMAMPDATGIALMFGVIFGCMGMTTAVIGGAIWLFIHGLAWLFWFVGGGVAVGVARKILRDAVETDRRHRD